MNFEREPHNQKEEVEQPLSLAELSRQYLHGKMSVDEYLARERQLTPRFGESLLAIEDKFNSVGQLTINQHQTLADGNKEKEETSGKDGKEKN